MTDRQPLDARARLKNPGLALLSALILGGPGLLGLAPGGAILLFFGDAAIYYLGVASGGFGFLLLIPWRAIALLYAMKAVTVHNRKILDQ